MKSRVADIITPLIVSLTSQAAISDLAVQIGSATLTYDNFIQAIIDFLIVAFVLFIIVKSANKFKRKNPEMDIKEVKVPTTEKYLCEIRDLLANQNRQDILYWVVHKNKLSYLAFIFLCI